MRLIFCIELKERRESQLLLKKLHRSVTTTVARSSVSMLTSVKTKRRQSRVIIENQSGSDDWRPWRRRQLWALSTLRVVCRAPVHCHYGSSGRRTIMVLCCCCRLHKAGIGLSWVNPRCRIFFVEFDEKKLIVQINLYQRGAKWSGKTSRTKREKPFSQSSFEWYTGLSFEMREIIDIIPLQPSCHRCSFIKSQDNFKAVTFRLSLKHIPLQYTHSTSTLPLDVRQTE